MTIRGEQSRPCSPTKSFVPTPNRVHEPAEPESRGTLRGNAPAYNPTSSTLRRTKHKDLVSNTESLPHEPPPSSVQSSPATSLYAAYRSVSSVPRDAVERFYESQTDIESHALFSQSIDPLSTFTTFFDPSTALEGERQGEAEAEEDPNIELAARISTLTRTFVKEYVSVVKGVAGVTYAELHAHMFQALERADGATSDGARILVDEKRLEELRREWYGDSTGFARGLA